MTIENSRTMALLLEVIGEDAVIEGISFDFEATTFSNVFGGKTITVTEACRVADLSEKYANCVIVHCTDEGIDKVASENVLAEILAGRDEKLPSIYGKALMFRQIAASTSGFERFSEQEINELIDISDDIVRRFAEEQE